MCRAFCRGRCYHLPQANWFLNGNILKIWQKGPAGGSQQLIDDLTYTYIPGTNKLQKVKDAVTANYGLGDFNDGANGDNNDYSYDVNGNLTKDLNKNITSIQYNILNLPEQITVAGKGNILYQYDAVGNKLSKTVNETGQPQKITTYLGNLIFENNVLQHVATEEGRARLESGTWKFDYFLKDHLGNTRMMLADNGTVLEETHYYPFGLTMKGISTQQSSTALQNKYLYNGKEQQRDLGLDQYDYGARFYDAQIGKWHTQDKFSEVYLALTPYQYAANNPIKNIDEAGHLLKDKDGNIIATSNGMAPSITRTVTMGDGSRQSIKIDMESVTIYTDAGTPVQALRAVKSYVASITTDENGNQTVGQYKEDGMYRNFRSNCHGYALADGNLWVGTEEGQSSLRTILADEFSEAENGSLSIIEWTENTGEQVIVHSGMPNADGTYNQKDDIGVANPNASRSDFTQGGERTNTQDGQRQINERSYSRKSATNKTTNQSSFKNAASKGVRITDPEEIKKILKELGW
ncbi:MAG: RHS repeat-associated core domain-containing protein [Niabella sp.]